MKFCFRIGKIKDEETATLDEIFEGIRKPELLNYLLTMKAGDRMHLVVRPRPGFDIEAKRNYFHGPMITWIVNQLRDMGLPHGREQVRVELVKKFVGVDDEGKPKSVRLFIEQMVEGDPRDPEMKYGDLLSDVRIWCRDIFGSEPPYPDQVDLGEECRECATPETI
jgi:hypothetical protein